MIEQLTASKISHVDSKLSQRKGPKKWNTFTAPYEKTTYSEQELDEIRIPFSVSPLNSRAVYRRLLSGQRQWTREETYGVDGEKISSIKDVPTSNGDQLDFSDKELEERASFLDLFYDLFVVGAFTAYSSTHDISVPNMIGSYLAYVILVWWICMSQNLYDVRFASPDLVHRAAKLLQICVLASVGTFSISFTLFPDSVESEEDMSVDYTLYYALISIQGISVTYFCSRVLLSIQYSIAYFYLGSSRIFTKWSYCIQILVTLASGGLFLAGEFLAKNQSVPHMHLSYILWTIGIFSEMGMSFVLSLFDDNSNFLFSNSYFPERVATLTLIIIGDGVVDLLWNLQNVVGGLGFEYKSGIMIALNIIVIYLLYELYFMSAREHLQFFRGYAIYWAYLHLFLHASILLLVEGMNSTMMFTNILNALNYYFERDIKFVRMLRELFALSYSDKTAHINLANNMTIIIPSNYTTSQATDELEGLSYEDGALIIIAILKELFKRFGFSLPSSIDTLTQSIVTQSRPVTSLDDVDNVTDAVINIAVERFIESGWYTLACVGGFLCIIALVYVYNCYPKTKYAWIPIYARCFMGIAFLCLIATGANAQTALSNLISSSWLQPLVTLGLVTVFLSDILTANLIEYKARKLGIRQNYST